MGYVLFLLSVLIATFYYFRMARRFDSFDSEITEDLQREMNSLILDFNQTANQNISLLEDRISEGKLVVQDLATQVSYLKQVRDVLDTEVRELQKSLLLMKEEVQEVEGRKKSLVQKTYEQISQDMQSIKDAVVDVPSHKKKKVRPAPEQEDKLDIDMETLFLLDGHKKQNIQDRQSEKTLKKKKLQPNIPKAPRKTKTVDINNTPVAGSIKAQVLEYHRQGWETQQIALALSIPKGEVDLIIQLFYG